MLAPSHALSTCTHAGENSEWAPRSTRVIVRSSTAPTATVPAVSTSAASFRLIPGPNSASWRRSLSSESACVSLSAFTTMSSRQSASQALSMLLCRRSDAITVRMPLHALAAHNAAKFALVPPGTFYEKAEYHANGQGEREKRKRAVRDTQDAIQ